MIRTSFKSLFKGSYTPFKKYGSYAYPYNRRNSYQKSRGALYRTASTDPVLTFLETPQVSKYIDGGATSPQELYETEDLRLYNPEGNSITKRSTGSSARIIIAPRVSTPKGVQVGPLGESYFYRDPTRVLVCIRRRIRKEVAHALGWPNKKFVRPPKWTEKSIVRCSDLGARFY